MFRLVVLSALVAVSLAAPSLVPLTYSAPLVAPAIVSSVPTSVSSHSSTVVHGATPVVSAYHAAPVVSAYHAAPVVAAPVVSAPVAAVETAPVVAVKSVASVPTSVSSYSSSVVHDAKPVVAVQPAAETLEIIEPAVEVKSSPTVDTVEVVAPAKAVVASVPHSVSSHSSTVVHGSQAFVAAPIVKSAPIFQYAAYPAYHSYTPYIHAW